jgi:hypothetical protein
VLMISKVNANGGFAHVRCLPGSFERKVFAGRRFARGERGQKRPEMVDGPMIEASA